MEFQCQFVATFRTDEQFQALRSTSQGGGSSVKYSAAHGHTFKSQWHTLQTVGQHFQFELACEHGDPFAQRGLVIGAEKHDRLRHGFGRTLARFGLERPVFLTGQKHTFVFAAQDPRNGVERHKDLAYGRFGWSFLSATEGCWLHRGQCGEQQSADGQAATSVDNGQSPALTGRSGSVVGANHCLALPHSAHPCDQRRSPVCSRAAVPHHLAIRLWSRLPRPPVWWTELCPHRRGWPRPPKRRPR